MALASSVRTISHAVTLEKLARLGFAAKGLIYLFIGVLATLWAFGEGGALIGSEDAVRNIGTRPFGRVLLWGITVGLGGFAIWRFVQASLDPESKRGGPRVGLRVGYAVSGLLHAALAVAAGQLALGRSGRGVGDHRTYLAKVFDWPGGALLVAVVAIAVAGVAVFQLYQAYTGKFMEKLEGGQMSAREQMWARRAGRFGLTAHAVVLAVIGYFLLRAASTGRSAQAKDFGAALRKIASESHGSFLFTVLAVGLVGYAVHMFFSARYGHIAARV